MRRTRRTVTCRGGDCPAAPRLDCLASDAYRRNDDTDRIDVLFVTDAPREPGGLLRDEDDFLLKQTLRRVCGPEENWAVTSLVRCLPLGPDGGARPPGPEELKHCRGFFTADLEAYAPRVVVAMGPVAARVLGAPDKRNQWVERDGTVWLTAWHPSTVGRNKNNIPPWYQGVELAFRLARGYRPPGSWGTLGQSRLLTTVPEVQEVVEQIAQLPGYCAVDVETRNLNKRYGNALAMIQFAWGPDHAVCIPLHHPHNPMVAEEFHQVRHLLRRLFCEPVRLRGWLTHFGKFEQTQIGRDLLDQPGRPVSTFRNAPMIDTGAMAYLLDENGSNFPGSYGLKQLARSVLGFGHYDDETLMARASGNLLDLPLAPGVPIGTPGWTPNLTDYGGMDAYVTYRLFEALSLEADRQDYLVPVMRLLRRLFSPVFCLLSVIERNGFWANLEYLRDLQNPRTSPVVGRLRQIDTELLPQYPTAQRANAKLALQASGGTPPLFGETPWVLDLQKDAHVRAWLLDECGLEFLKRGKSGAPSVDKEFLTHHQQHPEVQLVEERRGMAKLANAYIKQLIGYIDPAVTHGNPAAKARQLDSQDGRIRCDIHFTSTTTGRASASNPNMQQQVRSDTPAKAALKSIFQAEQPDLQQSFAVDFTKGPPKQRTRQTPTNTLVQLDFMANEVRWLCIMSGCPNLAKAFNEGKKARDAFRANPTRELRDAAKLGGDIHKQTASIMFDLPVADIDKPKRTATKSIVFGILYGRGVHALAAQLGKTPEEAQQLMEKFCAAFPVAWDWIQRQPDLARAHGYIDSPIGRRRRLHGFLVERDNAQQMSKEDRRLLGETRRMAMNSPIQGIASDASFIGSALFAEHIQDHGLPWVIQNVVHDSCVYQVPIDQLRQSVEVAEQIFTTGTMEYMTRHWGLAFNCPIEVEFEIGVLAGKLMDWDFTDQNMDEIITTLQAMEV